MSTLPRTSGADPERGHFLALGSPPVITGTVALAAVVAATQSSVASSVLSGTLVLVLVACALIDIDQRIIPNRLTGSAALLGLVAGLGLDPSGEPTRLLWAAIPGGFLLVASLANPAGLGMGDVKLLVVMGLFLGRPVIVGLLVALIGSIVAAGVIAGRQGIRTARKTSIPFGPYLATGGIVAALVGAPLIQAYVNQHG